MRCPNISSISFPVIFCFLCTKNKEFQVRRHEYRYNHVHYSRLELIYFLLAGIRVLHPSLHPYSVIERHKRGETKISLSHARTNKVVWDVANILKADAICIPSIPHSMELTLLPPIVDFSFIHVSLLPSTPYSRRVSHHYRKMF